MSHLSRSIISFWNLLVGSTPTMSPVRAIPVEDLLSAKPARVYEFGIEAPLAQAVDCP
jgi:hypothetical protein